MAARGSTKDQNNEDCFWNILLSCDIDRTHENDLQKHILYLKLSQSMDEECQQRKQSKGSRGMDNKYVILYAISM